MSMRKSTLFFNKGDKQKDNFLIGCSLGMNSATHVENSTVFIIYGVFIYKKVTTKRAYSYPWNKTKKGGEGDSNPKYAVLGLFNHKSSGVKKKRIAIAKTRFFNILYSHTKNMKKWFEY